MVLPGFATRSSSHGLVDAIGLDFYHLRENLQKSRRIVFGEDSSEGKTWLDGVMHTFRHEGYNAAWDQLVPWRSSLRCAGQAEGSQPFDELRRGASADDPLPRVPPSRLANWQRSHRKRVQDHDPPRQRPWTPLGWRQCRGHDGPGLPGRQPNVANLLVKPQPQPGIRACQKIWPHTRNLRLESRFAAGSSIARGSREYFSTGLRKSESLQGDWHDPCRIRVEILPVRSRKRSGNNAQ